MSDLLNRGHCQNHGVPYYPGLLSTTDFIETNESFTFASLIDPGLKECVNNIQFSKLTGMKLTKDIQYLAEKHG